MVQKFRKKPVEIEAGQSTRENWDKVFDFTHRKTHNIKRIDGVCTCEPAEIGCYVAPYIFAALHELIE